MKTKLLSLALFLILSVFEGQAQTSITACDTNSDGFESFNLTTVIPYFIQNYSIQNPNDYSFEFYDSESEASSEINPIANPTSFINSINNQLIWIRITNTNTNAFTIDSFPITVISIPIATIQSGLTCNNIEALVNNPGSFTYFWQVPPGSTNPGNVSTFETSIQGTYGVTVIDNTSGCQSQFVSFYFDNINPNVGQANLFFCDPMELPIYELDESIPQLIGNSTESYTITYFTSQSDAIANINALPSSVYVPTIQPIQILFARVMLNVSGCFSITTVTLNTNNCSPVCPTPIQLNLTNITSSSATLNWSIDPNSNTSPSYWQVSVNPLGQEANINTSIVSTQAIFTLTGLLQNTCYSIYVRSICLNNGTSQISDWSAPLEFCTVDCTNNGQCPEQLELIAFLDQNNNGSKDAGEPLFNKGSFAYQINNSAETIYGYSGNGVYNLFVSNTSNSYDISFEVNDDYAAYFSSSTTYSDITAPTGSGSTTYYFPIQTIQEYNDISVFIFANSQPRPGFTYTNTIVIKNNGFTSIPFGTLTFTKDNALSIISVSEISIVSSLTGFEYSFADLLPFETRYITVVFQVPTIPTINLGDVIINSVSIEPLNAEPILTNNNYSLSQVVVGSYDPNDKNESHGGKIVFADFTAEDYLYYTIRFENTGTFPAEFIRIEDTLENQLDESSFEMIDASHPYTVRRIDNQLVWNFININLPPTIQNPVLSQGYLLFRIKPKPGFAIGSIIENTAEIYFDYNPAIITNTHETEFVENLSVADFSNSTVVLYPNPVKDSFQVQLNVNNSIQQISIYDFVGKRIYYKENVQLNSISVDVNNFNRGIYLVEVITTSNQKLVNKIIKQ